MFPEILETPSKKPHIIQATIVYDLPESRSDALADHPKQELSLPTLTLEEPVEAEQPKNNLPEIASKLETPLPSLQQPISKSKEHRPIKPEHYVQPKDKSTILQPVTSLSDSNIRSFVTNMARSHLKNYQQHQQNNVAQRASRRYQLGKNSPIIDARIKNPFMSEDEKILDNLKLRANCNSATNKTAAVVLGFLGAQIDCSKPPPISGFIQDRIHKKSTLIGQAPLESKARPQSVVIKEAP